jgi:hypothetical protein
MGFMRATISEQPTIEGNLLFAEAPTPLVGPNRELPTMVFRQHFADVMPMNAGVEAVAAYLDRHQDWFVRCAQPMTVEAIGANSYALTIGRFNSNGYVIEPRVGLELLPQEDGLYRIQTLDLPALAANYTVDFQAEMRLQPRSTMATQVEWSLDLTVAMEFPKFIYKLPKGVIQGTGDRVLQQIVRQVSKRLTRKVQKDFHGSAGLPWPH